MKKVSRRALFALALAAVLAVGTLAFCVKYAANAEKWVTFSGSPHVYTGTNLTGGRIGPEIAEAIESGAPRSGEPTGGNLEKSPCGPDHEGSVDGVHLTDIGFQRVAKEFMKYIK